MEEDKRNEYNGGLIERTHPAFTVEKHIDGIYYMIGLIALRKAQWEAAEVVTRMIQLR
jgi:hypothetical protein